MSAVTWTPARVDIATGDEPLCVEDGWISSIEPSLAITKLPLHGGDIWGVTHVPSGWAIAKWYVTRGAAEALLLELAPLTDWSQDAPQLRELDELSVAVWRIRGDVYRREFEGAFGPVLQETLRMLNRRSARLEEIQRTRELGMKARARQSRRV